MSSGPSLPSLRPIAGKYRKRSDATQVKAMQEAAKAAKKEAAQAKLAKQAAAQAELARIEAAALQLYKSQLEAPFRFADLPPELQDMVCGFYAVSYQRQLSKKISDAPTRFQLSCLQLPPLAHVSRDVRARFLRVFFRERTFEVTIGPHQRPHRGTTYRGGINGINGVPQLNGFPQPYYSSDVLEQVMHASKHLGDPIYLPAHMDHLLGRPSSSQFSSNGLVLLDVKFSLQQLMNDRRRKLWSRFVNRSPHQAGGRRYVELSLRWSGSELEVEKWPPIGIPPDATGIFDHALKQARSITKRKEFKGFTADDLRSIANKMAR